MYDLRSEPNEFIGEDRAEAVAKACRFFEVEESELKINQPDEGEIYGLGTRAVIVAYLPGRRGQAPRPRGGDRDRDRPRSSERGAGPRMHGREGSDRGGRERGARDRAPRERPEQDRPRPARTEDSKGTIQGEIGVIGTFVVGVLERMMVGPFEISEESEGEFLIYQVRGAAADELGSGEGRAAEALQLLANQAAMHEFDDATRVIIDVEGGGERRESFLERLAERAAHRASDTKRSVALDPMNPKERRTLHMAIRDMDGVVTMSVGSGRYRQVVIVPEGAPEYEEALESAREAQERDRD